MNTRRTILISLLFVAILSFFNGHIASAHVLRSDGSIGAIFHIEPDDSPVSGEKTKYSLSFKDTNGAFQLQDCGCTVTLLQGSRQLLHEPLDAKSDQLSKNTITFPNPGVYTLEVKGVPKAKAKFSAFSLSYIVRVLPPSGSASLQPFPILLWIGFGMMIVLLLIASYKIV